MVPRVAMAEPTPTPTTTPTLPRRAGAEALGTFALVFAGCGAIVTNAERGGALGVVGVSLVFGLVILAAIAAFGHLSGAHFNPAVTTSFFLTRHLPARDAFAYIAAQLAGAIGGALALWVVWPGKPANLGATVPTIPVGRALLVEALMSALLMLVIISVATDTRAAGAPAAIAIGATIALDAMFGGPLTGASMNPARSLAPALVSGEWQDFWIYLVGPLTGAPLGAFAYQLVRGEHPKLPTTTTTSSSSSTSKPSSSTSKPAPSTSKPAPSTSNPAPAPAPTATSRSATQES
jgi:aquaporin NIP